MTHSPIPTGSTLQTSHFEALTGNEVATILCDLSSAQLCTYDCSRSALSYRFKRRLETDFKLLQKQLREGVQQLHQIVCEMRLCESGMDNSGPTPVSAQPDNSTHDPDSVSASEVDDAMRPFQPIVSPHGQPEAGWGRLLPKMLHNEADRIASSSSSCFFSFRQWCFLSRCGCVVLLMAFQCGFGAVPSF